MADPLRTDNRRYTYKDYASWPDEERWELIDGVAYDMSPAPAPRHQLVEILSPATAYKDQTAKHELYERHGVREYWIVNPERATVIAYRLGRDRRYGRSEVTLGDDTLQAAAIHGLRVSLAAVFAG